jgi:hypothetical protein
VLIPEHGCDINDWPLTSNWRISALDCAAYRRKNSKFFFISHLDREKTEIAQRRG